MTQDYFASLVAPASKAAAEAGTDNIRPMTPLRTKQAIQPTVDALYSRFPVKNSSHDFANTANGLLNPFTPDSGNETLVSGPGVGVAAVTDGYYTSNQNTYLYVNGGSKVNRVDVTFRGEYGVIALTAANNGANMVHVEFTSEGGTTISYWNSPDVAQVPLFRQVFSNHPDFDDGESHSVSVEVEGDFCTVWSDGILRSVAYDPLFSQITGNWFYLQAGTGDPLKVSKYYTFESFGTDGRRSLKPGSIDAGCLHSQVIHVGPQNDAGWNPQAEIFYVFTADRDVVFSNQGDVKLIAHNTNAAGVAAQVIAKNHFGHELKLAAKVGATCAISWQNREFITVGNGGLAPAVLPLPTTLSNADIRMSALPTSDPAVAGRLWNDSGTLKISAG